MNKNITINGRSAARSMWTHVCLAVCLMMSCNLSLAGYKQAKTTQSQCVSVMTPDTALPVGSAQTDAAINQVVTRFSDDYLSSPPTRSELNEANAKYQKLGISVVGAKVKAKGKLKSIKQLGFVKVFARQLKFNPSDRATQAKVNNVVKLAGKRVCKGKLELRPGAGTYVFRTFSRSVALLKDHLDPDAQQLFQYMVYKAANNYEHFWEPVYDTAYQVTHDGINTDHIYTLAQTMMVMAQWQPTAAKRLQYMQAFQRYFERFNSYSPGTANGIKPDGAGFHHWAAYSNYMSAFNSAADVLWYLRNTQFQVSERAYRVFRDALYHYFVQATDSGLRALSTSGRNPHARMRGVDALSIKRAALAGGPILRTGKVDPFLAKLYTRMNGADRDLRSRPLSFEDGVVQLNYASTGVYRHNNWVAVNKGFTSGLWGAEIYKQDNRYGRYQSYGALEILYPGGVSHNGFDVETWDWNMNPGTTVIRLPWAKLHAERARIDEYQGKQFAGALAFNQSREDRPLNAVTGTNGLFAMDFQGAKPVKSFGTVYSKSNHHNDRFTFKKSSFYFDGMIVNLASNISNNDTKHPTVTTLYQRLDKTGKQLTVDNRRLVLANAKAALPGNQNHWLINHYNTGFFVVSGGHVVELTHGVQQTPNEDQTVLDNISANARAAYHIGYLNHGQAPNDQGYEYIVVPNASVRNMQALAANVNQGRKPYTVHRKDHVAHVVEHTAHKRWGYSVFKASQNVSSGLVRSVSIPSLMMHQYDERTRNVRFSIASPDLGLSPRSFRPAARRSAVVDLRGQWRMLNAHKQARVLSQSRDVTRIQFELLDGLPVEINLARQ